MTDEAMIEALEARADRRADRRAFFRNALGAAALTAAGASALSVAGTAFADEQDDENILNFALNLEYLEANFYHFAVFGTAIPANLQSGTVGTPGAATGGRAVPFSDPVVRRIAREIANDELAHVAFLRDQLKTAAVAQPRIDLGVTSGAAFSTAARAAGLIEAGQGFDAYANDQNFLLAAFIFEDVGVSAYKGAAPFITSKTYLEAGAGILAVEAYHAATIRDQLYVKGVAASADKISTARDTLDGSSDFDQGISPTGTGATAVSNIAPLDGNGLAYSRSTGQVLNIVYLNSGQANSGGFFPAGVNGVLKTSAAN